MRTNDVTKKSAKSVKRLETYYGSGPWRQLIPLEKKKTCQKTCFYQVAAKWKPRQSIEIGDQKGASKSVYSTWN